MFQSSSQAGKPSASATQKPWRTVRLGSRTAWRLRPRSCAIIGAVAITTPIANSKKHEVDVDPEHARRQRLGPEPANHHDVGGLDRELPEVGQDDRQAQRHERSLPPAATPSRRGRSEPRRWSPWRPATAKSNRPKPQGNRTPPLLPRRSCTTAARMLRSACQHTRPSDAPRWTCNATSRCSPGLRTPGSPAGASSICCAASASGWSRCGVPLRRAHVLIDTLHPIHEGRVFRWRADRAGEVVEYGRTTRMRRAPTRWRQSPFHHLERERASRGCDGGSPGQRSAGVPDPGGARRRRADGLSGLRHTASPARASSARWIASTRRGRRTHRGGFSDGQVEALRRFLPPLRARGQVRLARPHRRDAGRDLSRPRRRPARARAAASCAGSPTGSVR